MASHRRAIRTTNGTPRAPRARTSACALALGLALVLGLDASSAPAAPPAPRFGLAFWEAMPGPMRLPVFDAMAYESREQLVVLGGFTKELSATRAIQIRHPIDGWLPIGSALLEPRARASLVPLAHSRILVLGGYSGTWGKDAVARDDGETLDPLVAGSAREIEPFGERLEGHSATPLPDGRVAVACGCSLRLFDPKSESWSDPIELSRERHHHAAVLTGSTLLLAGGDEEGTVESIDLSADVPTSVAWEGALGARISHMAGLAIDGRRALLAGGLETTENVTLGCTFFLDAAKRLITTGPALPLERGACDLTLVSHRRGALILDGEWHVDVLRGNANAALLLTHLDERPEVWRLPGLSPTLDLAHRMLIRKADGSVEAVGGYRFRAPDAAPPDEAVGVIVDGSAQRLVVDAQGTAD